MSAVPGKLSSAPPDQSQQSDVEKPGKLSEGGPVGILDEPHQGHECGDSQNDRIARRFLVSHFDGDPSNKDRTENVKSERPPQLTLELAAVPHFDHKSDSTADHH